MALSISELNAISHEYFDKTITQEAYDESAFLAWCKSNGKIEEFDGNTIQVPIRYKKLDKTDATTARAQVIFEGEETRTALSLTHKRIIGKTVLHWDEQAGNQSKSKIIDIVKDKAVELKEDFTDKFCTMLMTSSTPGALDITAIPYIVDSANTYGGIAVADDSNWAGVEDSTSTTLTMRLLQTNRNSATLGKRMPTVHFTTRELLSKFESILQPYVRLDSSDTKKMTNLGFANCSFYGAPVIADPFLPANYWLGLDMDAFSIAVNPDYNMVVSDWKELFQAGFPHALAKVMTFQGEILCRLRKTSFKLSALNAAL